MKKLSEKQMRLIVGFTLDRNAKGKEVHLKTIIKAANDLFHIKISNHIASDLLRGNGFSNRRSQTSAQGFRKSNTVLSEMLLKWLKEQHDEGMFNRPLSNICSFDFTFTSNKNWVVHTFSPKGGYVFSLFFFPPFFNFFPKKLNAKISQRTNSVHRLCRDL